MGKDEIEGYRIEQTVCFVYPIEIQGELDIYDI